MLIQATYEGFSYEEILGLKYSDIYFPIRRIRGTQKCFSEKLGKLFQESYDTGVYYRVNGKSPERLDEIPFVYSEYLYKFIFSEQATLIQKIHSVRIKILRHNEQCKNSLKAIWILNSGFINRLIELSERYYCKILELSEYAPEEFKDLMKQYDRENWDNNRLRRYLNDSGITKGDSI